MTRSTLRFHGPRLTDIREETGVSQKDLASRLGLSWHLVALWEASPAPDSPRGNCLHEPSASMLQDIALALDAHPSDLLHSYEDAAASERDEDRAAGKASGIRLDGEKLARMRKLKSLSYPQAAARARVTVADIRKAEAGRTIYTGALLRLLRVYEPKRDPVEVMAGVLVTAK